MVLHTQAGTCFTSDGSCCFIKGSWASVPGEEGVGKLLFQRENLDISGRECGFPVLLQSCQALPEQSA